MDEISTAWTGHELLDANGEKIGTIEDVRYGDATAGLKWLVVKVGLLGTKRILVPAGEVRETEGALSVPYDKALVKDAPGAKDEGWLSSQEERTICAYFGLDYLSEFGAPVEGCVEGEDDGTAPSSDIP